MIKTKILLFIIFNLLFLRIFLNATSDMKIENSFQVLEKKFETYNISLIRYDDYMKLTIPFDEIFVINKNE